MVWLVHIQLWALMCFYRMIASLAISAHLCGICAAANHCLLDCLPAPAVCLLKISVRPGVQVWIQPWLPAGAGGPAELLRRGQLRCDDYPGPRRCWAVRAACQGH